MLNNILMGVQIVLSVLLLLVIMPQEGKGTSLLISVEQEMILKHKLTLNQKENKHFF